MKEEISLTLASYIMGWEVQQETGASEAGEESVGAGLQLHRVEKPRTWSQVLGATLFKGNKKMRHSLDTTQPLKKRKSCCMQHHG